MRYLMKEIAWYLHWGSEYLHWWAEAADYVADPGRDRDV